VVQSYRNVRTHREVSRDSNAWTFFGDECYGISAREKMLILGFFPWMTEIGSWAVGSGGAYSGVEREEEMPAMKARSGEGKRPRANIRMRIRAPARRSDKVVRGVEIFVSGERM